MCTAGKCRDLIEPTNCNAMEDSAFHCDFGKDYFGGFVYGYMLVLMGGNKCAWFC